MKRTIRPSLVAWLLTTALLSALVSQTLAATDPSRVYLPIITNEHPKPGTTPTTTPSLTPSPTATVTPTTTPTGSPTITPSITPTGTVTPVESFRATLVPSASQFEVGQTVIVTATIYNEGSGVSFGLPQYRLRVETAPGVEQDQAEPLLTPARPDPITHNLGISPGSSDSAVFTFQAVRPGTFSFALTVSGEVCIIGAPSCAGGHWSSASARSITVTVLNPGDTTPAGTSTPTSTATSTATATATSTPTATVTPTTPASNAVLTGTVALLPQSKTVSRPPQIYVIILDISGSMSLNFLGQATVNGVVRQCGFGPDPELNAQRYADLGPCHSVDHAAWGVVSEQRFSIQREAVKTLINNLGPNDRVALLPMYPDTVLSADTPPLTLTDAAGKSALIGSLDQMSSISFGTPAATALRKANQTLKAPSTPLRAPNGQPYKQNVLMLVDGVANYYLEPDNGVYLSNGVTVGWANGAEDQDSNTCGLYKMEEAMCQIGYAATTTNAQLPRPIHAMVDEGVKLQTFAQVFVVGLAGVDLIGLDMVASSPYTPWLSQSQYGLDLPEIISGILSQIHSACEAVSPGWVSQIAAAHLPDPQPGLDAETFGYATLEDASGAQRSMPIRHDPTTGDLAYRFEQVPPGSYTLSAYLFYKGDDGVTRRYDLLLNQDQSTTPIRNVTIGASGTQENLQLLFSGEVCP